MSDAAYAVVFTYVPDEDRAYTTVFTLKTSDDPLSLAHSFRESEEERGDFPGSLWAVTGNDAASEIRSKRMMTSLFGEQDG